MIGVLMHLRDTLIVKFGTALFERPLFYSHPEALRFELSEGRTWIGQMLTALPKALVILGEVFGRSSHFVLCLRTHVHGGGFACRDLLRELKAAQIPIPADRSIWIERVEADDSENKAEPACALTLAFQVPVELMQNAVWCALAKDLGIRPRLDCSVYLINLETGVAVFPYDDRGMDVIGPRSFLAYLFERHQGLLLPYDLPRMQSAFGVP